MPGAWGHGIGLTVAAIELEMCRTDNPTCIVACARSGRLHMQTLSQSAPFSGDVPGAFVARTRVDTER